MKQVRKPSHSSHTLLMISSIYPSLTKAEKKVADVVRSNPEEAVYATVTDLSEKSGVGETSVIRFFRKLGYKGFHEFKLSIAQDLANLQVYMNDEIEETDDFAVIAQKITMNNERILRNTMELLNLNELKKAVTSILSANKVYIYGVGSSGNTAMDAHYRFMRLGMNVEVQRDSHIIAMSAALVQEGDVVIGVSTSGSTKDLVDPIKQAHDNGAKVICLTSHARSPITNFADAILLIPAKEMPLQGGALSTKIAQIHMLDILSTLLLAQKKSAAYDAIRKTASAVADKLY